MPIDPSVKPDPSSHSVRFPVIDAARGCAIILMVFYHLMFDLDYFGQVNIDFNHDPRWLSARGFIVSSFLLLVGISLQLTYIKNSAVSASAPSMSTFFHSRSLRRFGLLILCASLISLSSYLMYPNSFIFFGILHFITVASLLGLFFVTLNSWFNLALGGTWILIGNSVQHAFFDQAYLQWLGLMTHKPFTEDYVPLLPWFGVVLIGLFLGQKLIPHLNRHVTIAAGKFHTPHWLIISGRHSLLIYMIHQPILLGILYLIFGHN